MVIKFLTVQMKEPDRFTHHWYRDNANAVRREFVLEYDSLSHTEIQPLMNGPFLTSFAFACVNPTDNLEATFTVRGKDVLVGVLYEVSGQLRYKDVRIVLERVT